MAKTYYDKYTNYLTEDDLFLRGDTSRTANGGDSSLENESKDRFIYHWDLVADETSCPFISGSSINFKDILTEEVTITANKTNFVANFNGAINRRYRVRLHAGPDGITLAIPQGTRFNGVVLNSDKKYFLDPNSTAHVLFIVANDDASSIYAESDIAFHDGEGSHQPNHFMFLFSQEQLSPAINGTVIITEQQDSYLYNTADVGTIVYNNNALGQVIEKNSSGLKIATILRPDSSGGGGGGGVGVIQVPTYNDLLNLIVDRNVLYFVKDTDGLYVWDGGAFVPVNGAAGASGGGGGSSFIPVAILPDQNIDSRALYFELSSWSFAWFDITNSSFTQVYIPNLTPQDIQNLMNLLTDITQIKNDINNLESNLSSLVSQVNQNTINTQDLLNQVSSITQNISNSLQDLSQLSTTVTSLEQQVQTFATQITSLQNDITSIQGDITTLFNNYTTLHQLLQALDNRVSTNETNIAQLITDLQTEINNRIIKDSDLQAQIDSLNMLGRYIGTFDNYQNQGAGATYAPTNVSYYAGLTIPITPQVSDFIYIRQDETHNGSYCRYIITSIDTSTGAITWNFDYEFPAITSTLLGNKADKVVPCIDGHLAGLDATGNLTDSGFFPSDFALNSDLQNLINQSTTTNQSVQNQLDGKIDRSIYNTGSSAETVELNSTGDAIIVTYTDVTTGTHSTTQIPINKVSITNAGTGTWTVTDYSTSPATVFTTIDKTQIESLINNIPPIGDGIITIKDNIGGNFGRFSLNQSANADVIIPSSRDIINQILSSGAIKDSTVTLVDSNNSMIGSFTVNQGFDSTITIPGTGGGGGGGGGSANDALITVEDDQGVVLGSFTTNQAVNGTITIPSGSTIMNSAITNGSIGTGIVTIADSTGQVLGTFSVNDDTNTIITIPASSGSTNPPGDGTITLKDTSGNVYGTFTLNQSNNTSLVIPEVQQVNNAVISIETHNGIPIGSFSVNQQNNQTINLPDMLSSSIGAGDVLISDSQGTTLGTFNVNQSGNTTIRIPNPGDGIITVTDGVSTFGTFTANQGTNSTIQIPNITSTVSNLISNGTIGEGIITIRTATGTVLSQFSVNQAGNTTIDLPAPGNGTITVSQGAATLGTFTVNQSSNANISIPKPNDASITIYDSDNSVLGSFTLDQSSNYTVTVPISAALVQQIQTSITNEITNRTNADQYIQNQVTSIEVMGLYLGTFDNKSTAQATGNTLLPTNKSYFDNLTPPRAITINDFSNVRNDETHSNNYVRYIISNINSTTGVITWDFDYELSLNVIGKADMVQPVVAGNLAGLDSNGNLTDSGYKPSDFTATGLDLTQEIADRIAGDDALQVEIDTKIDRSVYSTGASIENITYNSLYSNWTVTRTNVTNGAPQTFTMPSLPPSGVGGQILAKSSNADYECTWVDQIGFKPDRVTIDTTLANELEVKDLGVTPAKLSGDIPASKMIGTGGIAGYVLVNQGAGLSPTWGPIIATNQPRGDEVTIHTNTTANTFNIINASITGSLIANSTIENTHLTSPANSQGKVLTAGAAGASPTWEVIPSASTDGVTIQFNAASKLEVKDGGISTAKIADQSVTLDKLSRTGTSGQVLTSQGTGASPSWTTPATPGNATLTLNNGQGGTNASITMNSSTNATFTVVDYRAQYIRNTAVSGAPSGFVPIYYIP